MSLCGQQYVQGSGAMASSQDSGKHISGEEAESTQLIASDMEHDDNGTNQGRAHTSFPGLQHHRQHSWPLLVLPSRVRPTLLHLRAKETSSDPRLRSSPGLLGIAALLALC